MSAYALLDAGDGQRLEQVGPYRVLRQATGAAWRPRGPWGEVDAVHHRSASGGGHWEPRRRLPESWVVDVGGLALTARLTPFGHIGFFPEHAAQWPWMAGRVGPGARVLNLFAYTGGATVACVRAGAHVTHVDAAKGIVDVARENVARELGARENAARELGAPPSPAGSVSWVVEDVLRFLERERRREKRYDAVLLDPPSFGRGAKGEVFKIEDQLGPLLAAVRAVLVPDPAFVLLTAHTPGYSGIVLANLVEEHFGGRAEDGEAWVADVAGRRLPAGSWARR